MFSVIRRNKLLVAKVAFGVSCAFLAVASSAYGAASLGVGVFGGAYNAYVASYILLFGLLLTLTFQPMYFWRWPPVVRPSPGRVLVARILVVFAVLLPVMHFVLLVRSRTANADVVNPILNALAASVPLSLSVYSTLHWAYRPEAFLSPFILRWIDPLLTLAERSAGIDSSDPGRLNPTRRPRTRRR